MRKNSGSEEMIWELQMIYEDVSMDAQYMDAVKRGDVETAQRMVDDAAREAGEPESKFIITKGRDIDGDEQLEIDLGDYLMTMLFPDSKNNAYIHFYPKGDPAVDRQTGTYRAGLRHELLLAGKRMAHEARRRGWSPNLGNNETQRARIYSKVDWETSALDPVTYNADGNVIPLSQRFNR